MMANVQKYMNAHDAATFKVLNYVTDFAFHFITFNTFCAAGENKNLYCPWALLYIINLFLLF